MRSSPWPAIEAAQGRRVLIGTYKPVAELLAQQLADQPCPMIEIASFGAIRGLDGWKDFDTVIVAGREQPPPGRSRTWPAACSAPTRSRCC